MLSRKEQDELDRLEKRFQKTRVANTVPLGSIVPKAEPKPEPKAEAKTEAPAIHVHLPASFKIDGPSQPEPVRNVVLDPTPAVRRWVFEHKYDEHNRLVKTTATAS